jgi:hypothetical protein
VLHQQLNVLNFVQIWMVAMLPIGLIRDHLHKGVECIVYALWIRQINVIKERAHSL